MIYVLDSVPRRDQAATVAIAAQVDQPSPETSKELTNRVCTWM